MVHSTIKKQLAVLTTFLCIMVTCMGWSVYAAYTSESLAKEATSQLQIYQAKQDGVERLMQSSLSRIEKTTIDLHTEIKEQRNMIEDIYKGKINHAP